VAESHLDAIRDRLGADRSPGFAGTFAGQPLPGDADFYVLRHAYQSMRPDDFARFLDYYTAEGRDVRARDGAGRTLAQAIARHAHAGPFIELLDAR
jgi:hypothetical protein